MTFDPGILVSIPIAFFIVRWVRRFVDSPVRLPRWDTPLSRVWLVVIGFIAAEQVFRVKTDLISDWYLFVVFTAITIALVLVRAYRPARTLLLAITPLMVCFVANIVLHSWDKKLIDDYESAFKTAWPFATIWLITFIIIARNQKKALEKERLRRVAEEEHNRQIEAQNAELERIVADRTAELVRQKEALIQTLNDLKTTQDRLVQKEKMASLGELTAGIAHEIQNPLNFVNNFSEVSAELLDELREGPFQKLPDEERDYAEEIMADLTTNIQKITHHGKRADSIVKGMLQHSRVSTGERQPTDINALADEYLRLSYHGLRAKDKSFNSALITDFDPTVGQLTVAGQDIGRVLLNMFNNSFYAVQEKKKHLSEGGMPGQPEYMPEVAVRTKRISGASADGLVEIRVRDNGDGIPPAILEKIYQPFFTTKPAGEGTGLGLSLSYDIITKGYGGTLAVDTKPGEFTEFIITLPARIEITVP
ncbi:MAG: histidine kinase [Bacteroidetes bacterium]|nr:histidine kinase [Fibrella sp.]